LNLDFSYIPVHKDQRHIIKALGLNSNNDYKLVSKYIVDLGMQFLRMGECTDDKTLQLLNAHRTDPKFLQLSQLMKQRCISELSEQGREERTIQIYGKL